MRGAGFNLQHLKRSQGHLKNYWDWPASLPSLEKKSIAVWRNVCPNPLFYPDRSSVSQETAVRGPWTGLSLTGTLVRTSVTSSIQTRKDGRVTTEEMMMSKCTVWRRGVVAPPSRRVLLVYPHCCCLRKPEFWSSGSCCLQAAGIGGQGCFLFSNFGYFFICFLFWLKHGLPRPPCHLYVLFIHGFCQESCSHGWLIFYCKCPCKSDFESKCCFVNYQVDVPTGYFTIEENTDT